MNQVLTIGRLVNPEQPADRLDLDEIWGVSDCTDASAQRQHAQRGLGTRDGVPNTRDLAGVILH